MKTLDYLLAVIFILFAAVQYNDPDPWFWIPVYTAVAALSYLAAQQRFYTIPLLVTLAICLAGSAYYFSGVLELFLEHEAVELANTMKANKPYIEEARESLGLLIAAGALAFHLWQDNASSHAKETN